MGISQASFVEDDTQFIKRVEFIHESMDQDAIAEEFIHGRELYVSLLGTKRIQVFPIRELVFREVPDDEPKFASYKVKWDAAYRKKWGIRYQFAGNLAKGIEEKVIRVCKKIYRLLLINGYARIDIRLTPEGQIYFIEANPNPILSNWEDFGWSADKAEISYPELIRKIIDLAEQG